MPGRGSWLTRIRKPNMKKPWQKPAGFLQQCPWHNKAPTQSHPMHVFLNGKIVPEEQAVVSVFDRGFLYGDGLFETMRIANGIPFRWKEHWERLEKGAQLLNITLPFSESALRGFADGLIRKNQTPEALLRLTITRGAG